MAEFVPFRGVVFNSESILDMADVVTPPYDVITAREQEAFYQRHPNNVVRLILGKSEPDDHGQGDIHKRAAQYFQQWMNSNILVRDNAPAFYLTSVTFISGDEQVIRYGIIGCVRIEPFDRGIVLPHECTFSKVKTERLQLMQACHTNFSPIFGLYADGNGLLERLIEFARNRKPDMDFVDSKGLGHRLWRITDSLNNQFITNALKDQCIYIADGHHRYETALNYRNWVRENTPGFDDRHPANFVMMSLSSLKDPGMVIFPAHRLLKNVSADETKALFEKLESFFDIHAFSTDGDMGEALARFDATLAAKMDQHAIGLYCKTRNALNVLVLKQGVMRARYADELPEALRDLDVTVLTRLLLMDVLEFDQNRLDDATQIGYATTSKAAVEAVQTDQATVAFILNPTRIEQVQRVSEQGLIMPRKSTYFYPKVGSGLVFNLLR